MPSYGLTPQLSTPSDMRPLLSKNGSNSYISKSSSTHVQLREGGIDVNQSTSTKPGIGGFFEGIRSSCTDTVKSTHSAINKVTMRHALSGCTMVAVAGMCGFWAGLGLGVVLAASGRVGGGSSCIPVTPSPFDPSTPTPFDPSGPLRPNRCNMPVQSLIACSSWAVESLQSSQKPATSSSTVLQYNTIATSDTKNTESSVNATPPQNWVVQKDTMIWVSSETTGSVRSVVKYTNESGNNCESDSLFLIGAKAGQHWIPKGSSGVRLSVSVDDQEIMSEESIDTGLINQRKDENNGMCYTVYENGSLFVLEAPTRSCVTNEYRDSRP